MPIKLNIPFSEKDEVKKIGAWWLADKKTWAIPDSFHDITPFQKWLPKEEAYLIKTPLIIAKAHRHCWKCTQITPLIALGARVFHASQYIEDDFIEWEKCNYPVLFSNIEEITTEVANQLQDKFHFFKRTYSKTVGQTYWANVCSCCGVLQGDFYNFEADGPFCPGTVEEANQIQVEHLRLEFDCYLRGSMSISTAYDWFIK